MRQTLARQGPTTHTLAELHRDRAGMFASIGDETDTIILLFELSRHDKILTFHQLEYQMDHVISAEECRRQLKESSTSVELQVTEAMIIRVDSAIRRALKQGNTSTSITVPEFLYGLPAFNIEIVYNNLKAAFANHGYIVTPSKSIQYSFTLSWGSNGYDGNQQSGSDHMYFDNGFSAPQDTVKSVTISGSGSKTQPKSIQAIETKSIHLS